MYKFDIAKETENLIKWIRDWFDENGKNCNAVLGISGPCQLVLFIFAHPCHCTEYSRGKVGRE